MCVCEWPWGHVVCVGLGGGLVCVVGWTGRERGREGEREKNNLLALGFVCVVDTNGGKCSNHVSHCLFSLIHPHIIFIIRSEEHTSELPSR